jgi:hypothetical protein
MTVQQDRSQVEAESRKRIHRLEVAALAMLLGIPRKQKPQSLADVSEMISGINAGIFNIRRAGRDIGLASLGNELAVHGQILTDFRSGLAGKVTDAKRAELYARRYAELWRSKFRQFSDKIEPKKAAELATKSTETRLRSIAITEANRSYNDEKRSAAVSVQEQVRVQIYEVWDAMRDACPVCASYDGEETPVGEPFANGESPGWVHPWCQCESHFITE